MKTAIAIIFTKMMTTACEMILHNTPQSSDSTRGEPMGTYCTALSGEMSSQRLCTILQRSRAWNLRETRLTLCIQVDCPFHFTEPCLVGDTRSPFFLSSTVHAYEECRVLLPCSLDTKAAVSPYTHGHAVALCVKVGVDTIPDSIQLDSRGRD